MNKLKKYNFLILLLIQIILLQIISYFPTFIEKFYSNGFFQFTSKFFRIIFGWLPFSIGDIIYISLGIWLIYSFIQLKKNGFTFLFFKFTQIICIFYFVFHLCWGFNYYRVSIADKMNLNSDYSNTQLYNFSLKMIENANKTHLQLTNNKQIKVYNQYSQKEIFTNAILAYNELEKKHSEFTYKFPSQKKSLISFVLSYMGFGGYINPFTNESQVNYQIPMYNFPSTTCHEMSHQIGYASESEANFIGFLATTSSKNTYFNYSGYTYALKYCLRNWEARNPKIFENLIKKINPGILKNFDESSQFWESKHTFIDVVFEKFYHNFLKLNQQEDGLQSYSKFVDLLINYYKI